MSYSGWKIADVQYLHHKAVTSIALEREDGKRLYVNVSDEAFESGSMTAYFPSDSQAKENPQTEESVVEAGTDFLMKVTEEAVISGLMIGHNQAYQLSNPAYQLRRPEKRDMFRKSAEEITLEELKRFVSNDGCEEVEADPDDEEIRTAHGIPAPVKRPGPRILPADRYAHGAPMEYEYEKVTAEEYEKYMDMTQGK